MRLRLRLSILVGTSFSPPLFLGGRGSDCSKRRKWNLKAPLNAPPFLPPSPDEIIIIFLFLFFAASKHRGLRNRCCCCCYVQPALPDLSATFPSPKKRSGSPDPERHERVLEKIFNKTLFKKLSLPLSLTAIPFSALVSILHSGKRGRSNISFPPSPPPPSSSPSSHVLTREA